MKLEFRTDIAEAKRLWDKYRGDEGGVAMQAELRAMPPHQRRSMAGRFVKFADREIRQLTQEKLHINSLSARGRKMIEEMQPLDQWANGALTLERPGGSCLHHLRQSIVDGSTFLLGAKINAEVGEFSEALAETNCFVIEHDWAKAFTGAADFSEGDIRLPYEICAFDFKISSRRVVALMTTLDGSGDILMQIMVRCREMWAIDNDICRHKNGVWSPIGAGRTPETNCFQLLAEFIGAQVRAVVIALDAQAAESEVVRVNEKLARSREKSGYIPPTPYRVVSLARRSRVTPLPHAGATEHGRVRLHFRRGHWRHYEDHKTWIRWMLVGNPDLGFVDKEYRL